MFLQKNLAIPKIDSIAMFLRRQISLGLCLHLLLERIIPATPWRTHVLWISPPLGEPEAKRKLLLAREERRQDLPEHNAGKPRSAFKPSLTLWRIMAQKQPGCTVWGAQMHCRQFGAFIYPNQTMLAILRTLSGGRFKWKKLNFKEHCIGE